MLGGDVQKAKRAGEKREKEKEMEEGERAFKYSTALDSAAVRMGSDRPPLWG